MSDVFVSYKTEDRRRVQPMVEALLPTDFGLVVGPFAKA